MEIKPFKMSSHEREKNGEDADIQDPGAFGICLRSRRPKFMAIVQNGRAFYRLARKRGKPLDENSLVNWSTCEYGGTDGS